MISRICSLLFLHLNRVRVRVIHRLTVDFCVCNVFVQPRGRLRRKPRSEWTPVSIFTISTFLVELVTE